MKVDVVVIGGGIVGCSTAYYLAKRGLKVLVIEKNSAVGLEASGRNAGGVRQNGRTATLPLAMESVRGVWGSLAEELQSDLEYIRTGHLKVALDEAIAEGWEKQTTWENEQGLTEARMLTAAECHEMIPGLTNRVVAGKFCPTDGGANPMLVTPAFARASLRLGVEFRLRTTVKTLLKQGTAVCGVRTETDEIEAGVVVNAAGPWAARFNEMVGCPTPIAPGRSELLITERFPRRIIPFFYVPYHGYVRQTVSGNLVMGFTGARNDTYSTHVGYGFTTIEAALWCKILPWLRDISIIRAFSGITEYTPDDQPYIGAVSPGLFVAAGFAGQGFCTGPGVGRTLADLITGSEPSLSLEPFRPHRFATAILAGKPPPPIVYSYDTMADKLSS